MKKAIMISISVLSILAILVTLFSCKSQTDKDEIKDESFGAAPVKVFKVKRQKISEKLFYTGLIEPLRKTNITPDIGGKIAKIYVNEGDMVEKGQLLAELDTRASILQLQQAQAGLAVSEANQKDAKRNMGRMERLIGEKAISDQQYEKIKLAYEAAGAQLKQAQAAVNLANYQLDVSRMKAPFSGVVASKNAEVGDVINPMMAGFSPTSGVLTLMDFSQVKINIDLSHQDVVRLKKGQAAFLSVSVYPNKTFQGRVALVNLTADPLTKKFKVEIAAENKNLLLRPNTFGEVTIEVNTKYNALIIPQKAILENKYIFLVNDSIVSRIEVKLGLQNMDMVEITKGIKAGDQVVVEGNYGLEDGTKIDIKEVIE